MSLAGHRGSGGEYGDNGIHRLYGGDYDGGSGRGSGDGGDDNGIDRLPRSTLEVWPCT